MQLARPVLSKGIALTAVTRNTSCKNGWLRLLVQGIFATITVSSFILIVIMAVKSPSPAPALRPLVPPRCHIHGCRVVCKDAPYYNDHEEDILLTVSEAENTCYAVVLELQTPYFINGTLPNNWLSKLHSNVQRLFIIGGNLMHIPSGAFMSQFTGNIVALVFQQLNIKSWESTSLVGLSSLQAISILNSQLEYVHGKVLEAVDDTLETLTISETGVWDPYNFTGMRGFEKLNTVDFSYNDFTNILGATTFVGLEVTKILYLNSCRITAIGAGAFDYLLNIEVLYLNNNMLITVPPGLFSTIVAIENPRPRIHIQNNFWYCDCAVDDFRQLVRKEVLLVDPVCTYPEEMHSVSFTSFEDICTNNNSLDAEYRLTNTTFDYTSRSKFAQSSYFPNEIFVNASNCGRRSGKKYIRIISPVPHSKCYKKKMKYEDVTTLIMDVTGHRPSDDKKKENNNKWLQFYHFLVTDKYSIVQIGSTEKKYGKYGIVWYQSSCPHEIFCLDEIPNLLRVYNSDSNVRYTFCLMNLESTHVENDHCIGYNFATQPRDKDKEESRTTIVVIFISTICICLCVGAVLVYGLVRIKPTLLRGSKRILFVKHKKVDALVLPAKVQIRAENVKNDCIDFKNKNIFTLSPDENIRPRDRGQEFHRMKSIESYKSGSPSYISAMQPTEDQLAEWRLNQHFNKDFTVTSIKSELSTLSWICGDTNTYHSLGESDTTYENIN